MGWWDGQVSLGTTGGGSGGGGGGDVTLPIAISDVLGLQGELDSLEGGGGGGGSVDLSDYNVDMERRRYYVYSTGYRRY